MLGSGLIDPEEHGGGETDSGHEGVGVAIVAHGDAASFSEAAEHVLDACWYPAASRETSRDAWTFPGRLWCSAH